MNRVKLLQITLVAMAVAMILVTITTVVQAIDPIAAQAPTEQIANVPREVGLAIGAGLAIGVAGCGAGIGMGIASASATAAIVEKPEVFGRTMIYVVFIEAIAIYALVIAIMLIGLI